MGIADVLVARSAATDASFLHRSEEFPFHQKILWDGLDDDVGLAHGVAEVG
jgi:hypothetical protein